MDMKDGLIAAAVVGLGYLGIKRVTKGAETFEATQWWNRQSATGHERPSGGYGGFYIKTDYDLGTIKEIFKDWKPKAYPYEKRITQDSFENWCEDCGEIHDEENLIHYQFYLPQSNSRRNRMRYVSGNYCGNDADCGANICESCYENGNQCEECSKIICDTCKEDSEYTTGNTLCYDCWPEEHQAETFSADLYKGQPCPHEWEEDNVKNWDGEFFTIYVSCKNCGTKSYIEGHADEHSQSHPSPNSPYSAESFSADMTSHAGKFAFQPARCQICFSHKPLYQDVKKMWATTGGWEYYLFCKKCISKKDYRAESFSADEYGVPFHLWAKGDMRIVADYDHDFWDRDIEGWGWESDEEYEQFKNHVGEYGVYILRLEKWNPEVGVGWDYVDSVHGNVPNPFNTLIDIAREQFSEFGDFKE